MCQGSGGAQLGRGQQDQDLGGEAGRRDRGAGDDDDDSDDDDDDGEAGRELHLPRQEPVWGERVQDDRDGDQG